MITPKTKYSITARAAYIERYTGIWEKFAHGHDESHPVYNALVPLDMTFVQGPLADDQVFSKLKIGHEYRAAFYEYTSEIPNSYFAEYLNNYHIIPANIRIRRATETLLKGDIIYLEGYLADISVKEIPRFRLETGTRQKQIHTKLLYGGMCFIMYVTKMAVNGRVYE